MLVGWQRITNRMRDTCARSYSDANYVDSFFFWGVCFVCFGGFVQYLGCQQVAVAAQFVYGSLEGPYSVSRRFRERVQARCASRAGSPDQTSKPVFYRVVHVHAKKCTPKRNALRVVLT